jgi:hypothetical protein
MSKGRQEFKQSTGSKLMRLAQKHNIPSYTLRVGRDGCVEMIVQQKAEEPPATVIAIDEWKVA